MSRRATDLLDVFRAERPEPGRASSSRGTGERGPEKPAAASAAQRAFEGLFLYPRQLLLGSAVVVLLLVFAFVLGLSVGRRGGAAASTAALARSEGRTGLEAPADETRVFVLARVPYVDKGRATPNEPRALERSLVDLRSVPPERLWILDEPASQGWLLVLGPFADKPRAAEFLRDRTLTRAKIGGVYPFESAEYRSLPVAGMPKNRLPSR